ncbi:MULTISPECIES: potassium channel family protein [Isoptericola]|nr:MULTISPECIES: potassium channel family protein [Isoptericola]
MSWLMTGLGGALVLVVMWDVFHTLWHPTGQGRLSKSLMHAVWRASRHLGTYGRRLSGAAAMVAAIGGWAVLMVLGWALIFWSWMPAGFLYATGIDPATRSTVVDALYLSLVSVTTLGYGDITPLAPWLRIVTPVEGLLGFALLTAAVSWVLQVYPALTRRRVLALRLMTLHRSGAAARLPSMENATAALLLEGVTQQVEQVHVDLIQYSETYYFRDQDRSTSLADTIVHAQDLTEAAQQSGLPDVRHLGSMLEEALDELARVLDAQFLHVGGGTDRIVEAFRADHRVDAPA